MNSLYHMFEQMSLKNNPLIMEHVHSVGCIDAEKKFLQRVQRLRRNLNSNEISILQKQSILPSNTYDDMFTIVGVYSGKQKKGDVVINIKDTRGKYYTFGISYKKENPRTIQSWTTRNRLVYIFGESNVKCLANKIIDDIYIQCSPKRPFLVATIHFTISQKKSGKSLNDILPTQLDRHSVQELFFGHDRSNCKFVYESNEFTFTSLESLLSSSCCYDIENVIESLSPRLVINIRYPYLDQPSTKSSQGIVYWVPYSTTRSVSIKTLHDLKTYGQFVYNNDSLRINSTSRLIERYYKKYDIRFPLTKDKNKISKYSVFVKQNFEKITSNT